jgi:hypothetical protein
MTDTPVSIEKQMALMMARKTPVERLRMVSSMFDTGKALMIAGLRRHNPSMNNTQLRAAVFRRLYGKDLSRSRAEAVVRHLTV